MLRLAVGTTPRKVCWGQPDPAEEEEEASLCAAADQCPPRRVWRVPLVQQHGRFGPVRAASRLLLPFFNSSALL